MTFSNVCRNIELTVSSDPEVSWPPPPCADLRRTPHLWMGVKTVWA
ncbi:hypothetical protein [Nonomuraea polychroma]|nr:hypothetical protein [Nonomuraea polychroma]